MSDANRDNLERHLHHELDRRGLTRRDLVKGGAALASAVGLSGLFAACGGSDEAGDSAEPAPAAPTPETAPAAEAPKFTGTLRVLGLGINLQDPVREAGEKTLGFKLTFDVSDTVTMVQKALTQPASFDVFDGFHFQYDQIWSSGNLIGIDRTKIARWNEILPLFKFGKATPGDPNCTVGEGDAAFREVYTDSLGTPSNIVQWGKDDGSGPQDGMEEPPGASGVPGIFTVDALGYDGDIIQREPEEVSWGELFNPSWKGRTALIADPSIGTQDAGNAAKALGLMEFGNLGNMTKEEIDGLTKILIDLKKNGQFRALWTTFDESVQLMSSREVVIQSMWEAATALVASQRTINIRYAAPPEGYRGWSGGPAISKEVTDPSALQAAYDYINWWHSGEPGGIILRQGYMNAVQDTVRQYVEPEEWDYWIEGLPAAEGPPGHHRPGRRHQTGPSS